MAPATTSIAPFPILFQLLVEQSYIALFNIKSGKLYQ
jgi:hypothetical protein